MELAKFASESTALIDKYYRYLHELDEALDAIGKALRVTQPPGADKYDIRWWRTRGGGERVPILVRWVMRRDKQYAVRPVTRVKEVRTDGNFALCHDLTRELLDQALLTLNQRKAAHSALVGYEKSLRQRIAMNTMGVADIKVQAERHHRTALSRLTNAGYDITDMGSEDDGLV